ncbi:ZIP family metal transporter [Candidatus Daviesbacteria bacterium]|nr:ZIP family metal transporter [Candidatus Daviesbacteria bacterium]
MAIFFLILTFFSTFIGGLISLRHKEKLNLILGFTAGVLLAVVSFDIFPEIIELVNKTSVSPIQPMIALVVGFLLFHILEKIFLIHNENEDEYGKHKHPTVGILSALALSGHSFLDGVGIGLGFQISSSVGIIVALAIIAHDFSDGLNTVTLMLIHKNTQKKALVLLFLDALAPVLGGLSTLLFSLPEQILIIYLGFFAGFLLYIGASDILPEAHSQKSSIKTIFMTLVGVLFIFGVTRLLN